MVAEKLDNRLIGLDGLRAVAVIAVVLYHCDLWWARGGYLGVDLFFVISGFLITHLFVVEKEQTGTVSIGQFYWRRAKRLLPASWVMMALTVVVAAFFATDALARLRGDVLASLGYVTNWEFIYAGQSYFESMGRQPLLLHLWSLAIEEQFYLFWAPVVFLILPRFGRRALIFIALMLAAASCLWMLWQADWEQTRLYFGTDTHGFPLFIGALLGLLWRRKNPKELTLSKNVINFAVASVSLIVLIVMMTQLGEETEWLYPWGFALCAFVSVALIALATASGTFGRLIDKEPMRWIGERSYGIYLWHWPIFTMTRPELDMQLDDISIFLIRITLTLVIAAISYRYIEMPIRKGALSRLTNKARVLLAVPSTLVAIVTLAVLLTVESKALHDAEHPVLAALQPPPTLHEQALPQQSPPKHVMSFHGDDLMAIGDSVLLGAKPVLQKEIPGAKVLAKVSKQAAAVLKEVQELHDARALPPYVLIHLGTNGYVTEKQLRSILTLLKEQRRVILMNTKVPRQWAKANNQLLERVSADFPNVVLANWNQIADHHPEFFVSDGVHLTARGQNAFVSGIKTKLFENAQPRE